MTRAVFWKEFREQGPIGLALLGLGSGVLAVAATQAAPAVEGASASDVIRFLGLGRLATLMLAVTAGMVCGGAVFASEREAGTMTFLESLPTTHRRLWKAKLTAGLGLTGAQVALLLVVAALLGLVPTASWALAVLLYALMAFVWGMFGSTAARTTLGSVGVAIPAAAGVAVITALPTILLFPRAGTILPSPRGAILFLAVMFLAPLSSSWYLFTRLDRDRGLARGRRSAIGAPALAWIAFRQFAVPAIVAGAIAAFLGLGLLAPDANPFLVWPALALAVGSLTGTLTFADEQSQGVSRYWAEQRLPMGRVWTVKIASQLMVCLGLLVALATPLVIRAQFAQYDQRGLNYSHAFLSPVFGTQAFDELRGQGWNYLIFPAIYGFAAGHLCGLIFRKFVVAWAVAGLVGGAGTVLWMPSLLAGGMHAWQLWLPPVLVLATGRILLSAWSADRLATRRPLAALAGGGLAAGLAVALGIAYRVVEVPANTTGEDDVAYVARLMPFEENVAGREFKAAAEHYVQSAAAASFRFDKADAFPPPPPGQGKGRPHRAEERLDQVPILGWPAPDRNLDAWLDQVFSARPPGGEDASWQANLATAVTRPLGIYEHPMMLGPGGVTASSLMAAKRMSMGLLARGLQAQARGDIAAFIPALRAVVTLARTMRNGSVVSCLTVGNEIESYALMALDRWIERLCPAMTCLPLAPIMPPSLAAGCLAAWSDGAIRNQRQVLRELIGVFAAADPQAPFDPTPQFLAERHIVREALKAPTYSLPPQFGMPVDNLAPPDPVIDIIAVAWAVPWEKERTRRLVGSGFESGIRIDEAAISGRPGRNYLTPRTRAAVELEAVDTQMRTFRRGAILRLALAAYRGETGAYPDSLSQLVDAGWLDRLPTDPYAEGRPFGYRISPGETLRTAPRALGERTMVPPRDIPAEQPVPAGQPIFWSIGPDRIDQGGVNPPIQIGNLSIRPEDVVFLMPMPK